MNNSKKYGTALRDVMMAGIKSANGEYGKEVLDGSNKRESTFGLFFRQLHIITETVFDTISDMESGTWDDGGTEVSDIETLVGTSVAANTMLYGRFYNITVDSGIVICYIDGPAYNDQRTVSPIRQVETPVIVADQDIVITSTTPNALIYYSTINPIPIPGEAGTTLYTEAIELPVGATDYYARAYKTGMYDSAVCKYTYTP